ncbi:gmc oxidoreductase [Moniliophthora roreri]|nr:gmc oxidoreductase [Moniliophthora roreri]
MYAASLALLLLPHLVASRPNPQKRTVEFSPLAFTQKTFDYVVVGGGTAGLIVATRLAEDPNVRVGLIEAGQDHVSDARIAVPQGQGYLSNPDYDWMMSTIPQPGAANRSIFISRGKMLGGSSGSNAMVWQRGHAEDYNAFSSIYGNEDDWSFDGLLPYFKKSENWTEPGTLWYPGQEVTQSFTDAHGHDGPIQLSYPNWASDVDVPMVEAVQSLGLPLNFNPDGGDSTGFPLLARNVDPLKGIRSYTGSQYFSPHSQDPNLVFLTGAQAIKINFGKSTGDSIVASGVDFSFNGVKYSVNATREVILAAGAVKTPQLLELSGVGDAQLLTSLGITPVVDLPQIGENLQDHPLVITEFKLRDGTLTLDELRNNVTYANEALAQYEESRTGPYTFTPLIYGVIPLRSITNDSYMESYIAKIDAVLASDNLTPLQKAQYGFYRNITVEGKAGTVGFTVVPSRSSTELAEPGASYVSVVPVGMHPFSRGSVHISSTDPLVAPVIDMGFLSNELDKDLLVEGLKFTRTWAATAPFSDLVEVPIAPGPEATTDADFTTYLENNVTVHNHASGTTAMASRELGGVVDSRLKVYGLSNVRVVDAGVLPMLVSAAINPTVIAVAEKARSAADIIKVDWPNAQNQKREARIEPPALDVYGLPFMKREAKIPHPTDGVYGLPFKKREGAKVFGAYGAW